MVADTRSLAEIYVDKHAEAAYQSAMFYVWGRQDAGEGEHDSSVAFAFAGAYMARRRAYDTEATCWMPNIRGAFEEWREAGTIT